MNRRYFLKRLEEEIERSRNLSLASGGTMSQPPRRERDASRYVAELKSKEAKEPIAAFLKMKLLELSPGYAKVSMKLAPEYQTSMDLFLVV
jgi:hypothetical protein